MAKKNKKTNFVVANGIFTREEIEQFEECILYNPGATEHDASSFFGEFPRFLTVGGYSEFAREIVLSKPSGEIYRVDFFRREPGEPLWDIVELKSPKAAFVVKDGKHWKFSAKINAAITQARNYHDWLENEVVRMTLEQK